MTKKLHIDDAQATSVEEHFQQIAKDQRIIESDIKAVTIDDLPEWFDAELFRAGQAYYLRNLLLMAISNICGLIATLAIPETLDVLVFTKQSASSCPAYRRYVQTLMHVYTMCKSDALDPKSQYYDSLNVIRWKHATANRRAQKAGIAGIYQRDMVITQFGFIGYVLTKGRELGLTDKPEEREAFNHFWRVNGHLLGIPDELNACRKNVDETTQLLHRIAEKLVAKAMNAADPRFWLVSSNAVNGLWYADFSMDADAFTALTFDLTGVKYKNRLSWYSLVNYKYRGFLMYLCSVPIIGNMVKSYYNVVLTVSYNILKHYPIIPSIFLGTKNVQLNMYPKISFS